MDKRQFSLHDKNINQNKSLPEFTEHNVIVISESSSVDGIAGLHVVGLMVGPFAELFSLVLSVLCCWLLCRLTHTDMNC